jgi:uncharacterized membrane protein YsdA (DUF1294 family)
VQHPWLIAIAAAYALMSLITLCAYGWDKRRAIRGGARIRERTLHLLELLGGWPGALVGRTLFAHKRRKIGFSLVTAAIIMLHLAIWMAALLAHYCWNV